MGDAVHCPDLDIKLHSVILEKCLAFLGLPNTYSLLGGRTCGSAYFSNGKVYKITSDKSEAIESNKLIGKTNNHIVNIYNVKKVNTTLTNVEVYLIVMERLNTNRESIFAEIEEELTEIFDNELGIHYMDLLYYYRFDQTLYKNEYEEDVNRILNTHQREKYYYNSLLQIVDELKKNNIESLDLQYHNLGLKPNGNLAFFDLGYGDDKGNVSGIDVNEDLKLLEDTDDILSVLKTNGQNVDDFVSKIIENLGYEYVNFLGQGAFGFAYQLNNNVVLKLTSDKTECIESIKLKGKNNKYLGNVYNVYKLNHPYEKFFIILREGLDVNKLENERYIDSFREFCIGKNFSSFDVIRENNKSLFDSFVAENQEAIHANKYVEGMVNVIGELLENNIKSADFSRSNFGFKPDGTFAFYDIGFSKTKDDHDLNLTSLSVNERVMSYMPNSSAIKVKKKCKINGNGDGTSTACDTGDIKNIELSSISEGQDEKIEYGVLMLDFNVKKWKEITDIIDKDDIYDKPTFGIEDKPHVTILYGFHKEVTSKEIEELLKEKHKPNENIDVKLVGISHFETPNYDVVKFDVKSSKLVELNKLMKKLPFTSDYPDYHPHMTISYVKKGTGKKYDEKFDETIELKSNKIVYSTVKGRRTLINEHTSLWNRKRQKKEEMVSEEVKISINDLPFKNDVEQAGGKLYSVGGAVRDSILGKASKDLDILITGLPLDKLEEILQKYGRVDSVGKSFGIIKFNTPETGEIDIAIPRTERKNDQGGYQGFDVTSDHELPIEKDLERRDFTINAIAKDSSGLMIDPYNGQGDIEKKQIKMVNPQAFSDDPLRMLRAVQFAARFGFNIEPETMTAIQQNAGKIKEISPERILIEFDKIVKKGDPLIGAKLLRQTGLYNNIFGINRGVNLADFNHVNTMGEFIFALTNGALQNAAEFFKNNMKGDLDTYNNIKALEIGSKFNGDKKTMFDMYKVYPKSLETDMLGPKFKETVAYMKANNIPFSLKEVPVSGNDLMDLGLQGKQIGDTFVNVLNKIYKEELPNDRDAILNYIKTR